MIHEEPHPLTGKVAKIRSRHTVVECVIEDWWDRIAGKSWKACEGNPAVIGYAVRAGIDDLPIDDEVVYIKEKGLGFLVHESEFEEDGA